MPADPHIIPRLQNSFAVLDGQDVLSLITIKLGKRLRLYLSNWQHPHHAGISSHSSSLFTMPTLGRSLHCGQRRLEWRRLEERPSGLSRQTQKYVQRSLEAASAHANDIHRTLPWCAQKCPSRFGGLSMEGNDKVRKEGGRSHPFHTREYE